MAHNLSTYAQEQAYARVQMWNRSVAKSKRLTGTTYFHACDIIQYVWPMKMWHILWSMRLSPWGNKVLLSLTIHRCFLRLRRHCKNTPPGPEFCSARVLFSPPLLQRRKLPSWLPLLAKGKPVARSKDTYFTLAEKMGFDVNYFYEFIPPAWQNYDREIRDGAISGSKVLTPTLIIEQIWNYLTAVKALGGEGLDLSACSVGMLVAAGLYLFKGEDFSFSKQDSNGSS
ncbi:NAD binding domain of 6-phosphogluconate dehydrogenase-domain-containing protein [Xylaria venustula]|nr:NAD binding domain of 6-phosphogluconate dehydrogenase-domain-containing protein [Xylaria venustula]